MSVVTAHPSTEQDVLMNVKVDFCVTSAYWVIVESGSEVEAAEAVDVVEALKAPAPNALVVELP